MSEMGFWDYLTLAVALGVIALYVIVRIRALLNPNSSGCSCHLKPTGCSQVAMDSCHTRTDSTESTIKWAGRKSQKDDNR